MKEKREWEYRARKEGQRAGKHGDAGIGAVDCLFQIQRAHKQKRLKR